MKKVNNKQTELTAEDLKYFAMTREEEDERSNRLAFKALNGIVDEETMEAEGRVYRNWELLYGKEEADRRLARDKRIFSN